jgi:hypothetical protein
MPRNLSITISEGLVYVSAENGECEVPWVALQSYQQYLRTSGITDYVTGKISTQDFQNNSTPDQSSKKSQHE